MNSVIIQLVLSFCIAQCAVAQYYYNDYNPMEDYYYAEESGYAPVVHSSYSSYSAPAKSYSAPSYSAPAKSYGAPSYSAPAKSYGAPSYSAPVKSYGAPSYSAPSYSSHSYSYPSPAPPVKCGGNILMGCAPTVQSVPCQSYTPSYSSSSY